MNHNTLIKELIKNRSVFQTLLHETPNDHAHWKPGAHKWCLLEIICHLHDEEREDFRFRMKHVFKTPELPFPPIDPQSWSVERGYLERDFNAMLELFLQERLLSIEWLSDLKAPNWKEVHLHPKLGPITPELLLVNWVAHDYIHLRQIIALKHGYLQTHSKLDLSYAGEW